MTGEHSLDQVITELPVSRCRPDTLLRIDLVVGDVPAVYMTGQRVRLAPAPDPLSAFGATPHAQYLPLADRAPADAPGRHAVQRVKPKFPLISL